MVQLFTTKGLLSKGDNSCPRISRISTKNNGLSIEIQNACYYDQVATNLSLDYVHHDDISKSIIEGTIRNWDLKQSKTEDGAIPSFEKSNLANTIGVALGITAMNKNGQKMILIRKRTSSVAVYQNMLHLPFSFALNFDPKTLTPNTSGSIIDLIKPDFRHEQADELGLEPNDIDFHDLKPLMLCRDICRGGKPQFFLEIEMKAPFEDLINKISERQGSKNEFESRTLGMTLDEVKNPKNKFSPELLAYIVAKTL